MLDPISYCRDRIFYGKKAGFMGIILSVFICLWSLPAFCASSPGDLPEETGADLAKSAAPSGPPSDGGSIFFGTIGEASNLIPYLTSDSASHEVAELIYVAPLRYNKDLQAEPWAAESWSMEDEGRLMRFTLRKGILWEDGQELTADDVAFTCKLAADPATGSPYAEDFLRIKDLRVIDRYTFEVRYDQFFARAVSTWMNPILPKHILEGQNIRSTPFARKPMGAGPYRLKSWEPGSRIVLEASPTYFAGKPHINEVVYRIIPDNATMFMETRAGRLDVMDLSPLQYLRQTSGPEWQNRFHKFRYLASVYIFLGFNLEHPFFKDVRVRRAISMAIDRDGIIKGVLLGQGVPAFGPFKPGSWPYHPGLKPMPRNVAAARALLAEAGFADHNGDGCARPRRPASGLYHSDQPGQRAAHTCCHRDAVAAQGGRHRRAYPHRRVGGLYPRICQQGAL